MKLILHFIIYLVTFYTLNSYAEVGQLSNDGLKNIAHKAVLIDIRRPEEWRQTGIIKGSHLLTFFDKRGNYNVQLWMEQFHKIVKKDQPVILICRTGNRTGMVSRFLDQKLGYKNINHLSRGITQWIKYGNPVVKP